MVASCWGALSGESRSAALGDDGDAPEDSASESSAKSAPARRNPVPAAPRRRSASRREKPERGAVWKRGDMLKGQRGGWSEINPCILPLLCPCVRGPAPPGRSYVENLPRDVEARPPLINETPRMARARGRVVARTHRPGLGHHQASSLNAIVVTGPQTLRNGWPSPAIGWPTLQGCVVATGTGVSGTASRVGLVVLRRSTGSSILLGTQRRGAETKDRL